jgi:PAS domain S-box-containing protein
MTDTARARKAPAAESGGKRQGAAPLRLATDADAIYRAIFEHAGVGIFQTTPEGRYVRANRRLAAMLGYDSTDALIAGVADIGAEIYVDPARRETFKAVLARDGRVENFVSQGRRRTGELFWGRESATGVYDTDGHLKYYVGTCEDVTELVAAQETLRQSAAEARLLSEQTSVGLTVVTVGGRVLKANARAAAMFGYRSVDAFVSAVDDIARLHYVDPGRRQAYVRRIGIEGAVSGLVAELKRVDGTRFWARLSASHIGADGTFVATVEDVTALIEAQHALALAEAEYRHIFENASVGIYRSSPDGRQLRANPALVRLNGYSSEAEMLAGVNNIATEWYVDAGRRDEFKRQLAEAGRVSNFESEVFRHKSRERIWISENAWPVRDAEGRILHYEGTVEDITARRSAEAALRASEQRFADFADTASDWFWETGPDHRTTYVSEAMRQYGADPARAIGRVRWDLDLGANAALWERHRAALDKREPFRDLVYRSRLFGDDDQWVSVSGKPVFAADGAFLGYRGSGRLVTAQVRAERRLRESEERFREFAGTASDWLWETDAEHRFVFISDAIRRHGGNPARGIGKTRFELADDTESNRGVWEEHRRTLDRREPFRDLVYSRRMADGAVQHLAASGKPVFDEAGAFRGYRGTTRVITDQVLAERRLAESQERFRDFAGIASDWFWETGPDHRFTYLSSAVERHGGTVEAGLGRYRWDFADDAAEAAEKWANLRAAMDRREPFRDFVYRGRMANGATEYLAVNGKPIYGEGGAFLGYRGITRVVTEEVMQRKRLSEARIAAEQANAAKSAFLASMSHELRTPLNAIIGFSEVMERALFGPLGSPRYESYVKDVRDSAQHLLRLITDILDLSKADAGKLEIDAGLVDVAEEAAAAIKMVAGRAAGAGIALVASVAPDLPRLSGDERRIRQVLLNLLSNAVKFTPGGGRVDLTAVRTDAGGIVVTVADTGIGIAAADLPRVFEPFVQLNKDVWTTSEGTGLGLPLTRDLVERHGGRIEIASEPGRGTTVTVSFPAERTVARQALAPAPPGA